MPMTQDPDAHQWDYNSGEVDEGFELISAKAAKDSKVKPTPSTPKKPKKNLSDKERIERLKAAKARLNNKNRWTKRINAKMEAFPMLKMLEDVTGIPKTWVPILLFLFVILLIFWGIGMSFIAAAAGFVFPIHQSFKALNHAGKDDAPLKYWLKFWVVWMTFYIVETFSDEVFRWIPFYYLFKFLFLIWCFLPQYRGAEVVYRMLFSRILSNYEDFIDNTVVLAWKVSKQYCTEVRSRVAKNSASAGNNFKQQFYMKGKELLNLRLQRVAAAKAAALAQKEQEEKAAEPQPDISEPTPPPAAAPVMEDSVDVADVNVAAAAVTTDVAPAAEASEGAAN